MKNQCTSPTRALKFGNSPNNAAIEMPKRKVSTASRLRQYVTQLGENVFSTDGTILFCKVWEVKKHLRALGNVNKRKVSQLLLKETASTSSGKSSLFFKELCEGFVSANQTILNYMISLNVILFQTKQHCVKTI